VKSIREESKSVFFAAFAAFAFFFPIAHA